MIVSTPTPIPFVVLDQFSGDPVLGVAFSGADIQVSKNSGAWVNYAGTTSEKGGASSGKGAYDYLPTAGEGDTVGKLAVKFEKVGYITQIWVEDIFVAPATAAALATAQTGITAIEVNADTLPVVLALLHHNAKLDKTVLDADGFMTSARLRGFADAAALAAAVGIDPVDDAESEVLRFTITGVKDGLDGTLQSYKIARTK